MSGVSLSIGFFLIEFKIEIPNSPTSANKIEKKNLDKISRAKHFYLVYGVALLLFYGLSNVLNRQLGNYNITIIIDCLRHTRLHAIKIHKKNLPQQQTTILFHFNSNGPKQTMLLCNINKYLLKGIFFKTKLFYIRRLLCVFFPLQTY